MATSDEFLGDGSESELASDIDILIILDDSAALLAPSTLHISEPVRDTHQGIDYPTRGEQKD